MICCASSPRPSSIEFKPASSNKATPESDCTAPSCSSFARRRLSSCSAVMSWSDSRERSASRTRASSSSSAFSCSRAAKSARTVARTTSSRSKGRWRVNRSAPISSSCARSGMTIAFSAGARRGRSPGPSSSARASNSLSASWRVRSKTSAPPAIDPIVSTSDSRKRASLVSSRSAASCRRRSVTTRNAPRTPASAIATARPASVSGRLPTASATTASTAAEAKARTSSPALVDDRFAKRNRNRLRPSVRLELGEDVADMALHGLLTDEELRSDVLIGHAVREQLEDLPLAPGQHLFLVLAGQERGHQRRVDVTLAPRDLLYRPQQRLVRRLLEDVTLRARFEPSAEQRPLAVRGEDQHSRLRDLLRQDLRRLEPVHPGHAHVHDHDVGPAPLSQRNGARPVGRLADHANVRGTRKRKPEPLAHDLVVVDDEAGDLGGGGGGGHP